MTAGDISSKYEESFEFLQERKRRWVSQLVLLNNLQRGDQNIASTLLLTLFNRVLSSLYDDKLQVKFLPSQGIMQEQINAYNTLAQSDYLEMNKARIDYDWSWDTLAFGRGYLETLRFNKKRKIMEPHVINPLMFGYDPYFDNPQEWRYYWKWITKTKWEIEKLIKAGVITGVKKAEELPTGVDTYLWDYKTKRDAAKKGITPSSDTHTGDVFQILEFFGYDDDGDRAVFWTDKDRSKIIFETKLKLEDGEEDVAPDGTITDAGSKWPIVVKEAFREPHSSMVFSIFDILEDKHRAKSVLLNLAFIAAKDRANPIYMYNPDKVTDVSQLFSRQINQHIPVSEMDGAVMPLNTQDPMSQGLIEFISMLTDEANAPVGTGEILEPQIGGKGTATEAAITQQLNDMAQSLQSKVMQFGESEFWGHWFHRYALYGEELGSKMANIVGVKGITTEEIDLKMFNTDYPPGVFVYSAKEAEYKELVVRRDLMTLYPQLAQTLDADGLRNFDKHVFFPKFLDDPSLIDIVFPKTIDEIKAEDENESLAQEELPRVSETDNHTTHIYTHMMLQPKTNAVWFHIAEHREMLEKQKKESIMQEQMAMQPMGQPQPASGAKPNAEKRNPMEAASPLKSEMQTSGNNTNK
uniref:Portal protein n=1 Tax=viral metagenome TaxID=1070528 RepID=A0A6M3J872_9ZZZZ